MKESDFFTKVTAKSTEWFGSPIALLAAVTLVLAWLTGLLFVPGHFTNNIYQLAINTLTTIITFLMVFIIQASQNRDARAIQAKLDAILKDSKALPNEFVGIEALPEDEISDLQETLTDPSSGEESHDR